MFKGLSIRPAPLTDDLTTILSRSLQRRSASECSRWAQNYMIMGKPTPGPLSFTKYPWAREWMDNNDDWDAMKAAQMGVTNAFIARSLFTIDIKRISVLYILPKRNPDATDFSKSKFDGLLELSPYLQNLFSNVRNVGHKQAGSTDFYIRGSRSRSGLKSISTGLLIYDEFDEMVQANITLADERASGYDEADRQTICGSTPTIPKFGIAREMESTDNRHYFFKCPRCSQQTELLFPESIKIYTDSIKDKIGLKKSTLHCLSCKADISTIPKHAYLNEQNACWQATTSGDKKGYYINQLYSFTEPLWKIALKMVKADEQPADEQELFNSKMGLPHLVKDAIVDDEMLDACSSNYTQKDMLLALAKMPRQLITMGVDVGKKINYEIDRWLIPAETTSEINTFAVPQLIKEGECDGFDELNQMMYDYQVVHCVVDINPETRKASEFADKHDGRVNLCYFSRGIRDKTLKLIKQARAGETINFAMGVSRTTWLDISQSRFARGQKGIYLPSDLSEKYKMQVKNLARTPKIDNDGNPITHYKSLGADHFAFSRLYSEIALPLAVAASDNCDISALL